MVDQNNDVTKLLQEWAGGDPAALGQLFPVLLGELRTLARSFLARERQGHTLQPTDLISELFVRLLGRNQVQWQNRAQFFKSASELMRYILVDHARRHRTFKRGGDVPKVTLDEAPTIAGLPNIDFVAIYDALDTLDPERRQLVELKFFFGWTHQEIGDFLGVSPDTVKKRWRVTKARLYRELKKE